MVGVLNKAIKRYSSTNRRLEHFNNKQIKFKQILNRIKYLPNITRRAYYIGRRRYRIRIKLKKKHLLLILSKKKIFKVKKERFIKKILILRFYILKTAWLLEHLKIKRALIQKIQLQKYKLELKKKVKMNMDNLIKKKRRNKSFTEILNYSNKELFSKRHVFRKYLIKNSKLRKVRGYSKKLKMVYNTKSKIYIHHFDERNIFTFLRFMKFSFKFLKRISLITLNTIKERKRTFDIYREYLKENKNIESQYSTYKTNIKKLFICCIAQNEK